MTEEVKPGYKRTEIGVIPEDWDFNSIESVTPIGGQNGIVDGPFGSNLKTIHYRKTGIPIITSGYVTTGKFDANEYLYVDKKKFEEEKRSAVKAGDIVMAKIGARCGSSAILPHDHPIGILSGNSLKITVDQARHSTFYIWQVLWSLYSNGRIDELKTVGAQPAVSMANLKKYRIPLPQLAEQAAIESALSDADALIRGLDQLIAKKRDIQQAAMQQLLTGQRRLPGFSGKWKVKRLGDLVSRMANGCVYTSDEKTGAPITRIETISDGTINWERIGYAKLTPEIESYKIQYGDILYSHINSIDHIGKVARYSDGKPLYHGMNLILLRPASNVDSNFLFILLSSEALRRNARTLAKQAVSQASINTAELRALELIIPEVGEQSAIVTILSDINTELVALEARRDKARQLKQGMMQELLTGRTRLI